MDWKPKSAPHILPFISQKTEHVYGMFSLQNKLRCNMSFSQDINQCYRSYHCHPTVEPNLNWLLAPIAARHELLQKVIFLVSPNTSPALYSTQECPYSYFTEFHLTHTNTPN